MAAMTHSYVVSRGSVRITLTVSAHNDIYTLACDIQKSYLALECREQVWIVSGLGFGSEAVQCILVKKAFFTD